MTNEEAISVIENEIQIDVRLCTDEQVDRFQTALYMAISALRAEPTGDSLTLEQLRKMDGQPAYWLEDKSWGIISVDSAGPWAGIPFFRGRAEGVNFEYDIESRGMEVYDSPPAHIDREAWKPCAKCVGCGNCYYFLYDDDEYPCDKCSKGSTAKNPYPEFKPIGFCKHCGRPLTEKA